MSTCPDFLYDGWTVSYKNCDLSYFGSWCLEQQQKANQDSSKLSLKHPAMSPARLLLWPQPLLRGRCSSRERVEDLRNDANPPSLSEAFQTLIRVARALKLLNFLTVLYLRLQCPRGFWLLQSVPVWKLQTVLAVGTRPKDALDNLRQGNVTIPTLFPG